MCENWYSLIPVVVACSSALFQSGHTNAVCSSNSSALLSLVGDTMCSTNDLPFGWASDYEVAVVYITSMWSEIADVPAQSSSDRSMIARLGFLSYCVRFKSELAAWSESLRDRADVSDAVKKTVSNWYRAVDNLSHDNWTLPDVPSVESYEKQFRTSYKHLVVNGAEVYGKAKSGRVKRDVNDFVKRIADTLIGILKEISRQFRDIPKKDDTKNAF